MKKIKSAASIAFGTTRVSIQNYIVCGQTYVHDAEGCSAMKTMSIIIRKFEKQALYYIW